MFHGLFYLRGRGQEAINYGLKESICAFCNQFWLMNFDDAMVLHLPRIKSDHHPVCVLACNSDQAEMWGCFVGSQISMASLIQTYYSENGFVSSGGSFEWRFLFLNSLYYFVLWNLQVSQLRLGCYLDSY